MSKIDYSTHVTGIDGTESDLTAYQGKVMLVVNVASKCGFTPQYDGLEKLYQQFQADGFEILGFPCNQFGRQEPGSESDIKEFCRLNYGVSFPMHAKIEVNGKNAHPLYEQLKSAAPGVMGTKGIKWNFTKFLVGRDGTVIKRFAPKDSPKKIASVVGEALATEAAA